MQPIHLAGEMAVWSEEKWSAFERALQRRLHDERRRRARLAIRSSRVQALLLEATAWGFFIAAIVRVVFYR